MSRRHIGAECTVTQTDLAGYGLSIKIEIMSLLATVLRADLCGLANILTIKYYIDVNSLAEAETKETLQHTATFNLISHTPSPLRRGKDHRLLSFSTMNTENVTSCQCHRGKPNCYQYAGFYEQCVF